MRDFDSYSTRLHRRENWVEEKMKYCMKKVTHLESAEVCSRLYLHL